MGDLGGSARSVGEKSVVTPLTQELVKGTGSAQRAYDFGMALSEDEKQRIREEELVRLQARQEFRGASAPMTRNERLVAIGVPLFVILVVLWNVAMAAKVN